MPHLVLLLALLAFGHFIVDTIASTLNPLWPQMESAVGMSEGQFLIFGYLCWTMANSFTQVLFAYLGDRTRSRWVIWAGPVIAILCLSSIGWIENPWLMCLVLFLAGLGIAAFHPEAAVTAGSMLPGNRSRAMAVFALCGYLGQAVGPYYAGRLVTDGVTAEEVARVTSRLRTSAIYARDSLRAGPNVFGRALSTGRTVADVEAWPERIAAVTAADVDAAARAVFVAANSVTSVLLPDKGAR